MRERVDLRAVGVPVWRNGEDRSEAGRIAIGRTAAGDLMVAVVHADGSGSSALLSPAAIDVAAGWVADVVEAANAAARTLQ